MKDKQLDHLDERAALEVRFDKKELIKSSAVTATSEAPGEEKTQALRGTKNGNRSPEGRRNRFSLNLLKNIFGRGKLSKASGHTLKIAENGNVIQAEDRTSTTDTAESSATRKGESMSPKKDWSTPELSDTEEEGRELGSGARVGADEPLDSSTLRHVIQQ